MKEYYEEVTMNFLNKICSFFRNQDCQLSRPPLGPISSLALTNVNYLINDPTTPNLRSQIPFPPIPKLLPFRVRGESSEESSNCHITVATGIKATQEARSDNPIKKWASGRSIEIIPKAKKGLNAYYNRRQLVFFYDHHPKTRKMVFAANSSDVVAHELGHALLDAQRPDFWSVQAPEIWAFHEAYADITAMYQLMQHDKALEHALQETKNDLRKSNVISRLAEEMGNAIYHLTRGQGGRKPEALRDAINNFKWAPPNKLPKSAPDNRLASECHSYGRVFLGAWYDILVKFFEYEKSNQTKSIVALKKARDQAFKYLVKGVILAPRVPRYHNAVAKSMLMVAEQPYEKIMNVVFRKRRIITPKIKMLSTNKRKAREILATADKLERLENGAIARMLSKKTIKLANFVPEGFVSALTVDNKNLADLEIEVANESSYEFDRDGNLTDEHKSSMTNIVDEARLCALMIQKDNSFSSKKEKMWSVQKGKLMRMFIE